MQLTRRRLLKGLVALPAVMAVGWVATRFGHVHEFDPLRNVCRCGMSRELFVGGHAAALARSMRRTKETVGAQVLNRYFD